MSSGLQVFRSNCAWSTLNRLRGTIQEIPLPFKDAEEIIEKVKR